MRTSNQKAKAKLDKTFAKFIRLRDGNRCVVCGSTQNPNCGHYFSRKANGTRYDERNCNCQCASCNVKHNDNPEPYRAFMVKKYGEKTLDILHAKYLGQTKFYTNDLEEMNKEYKRKIKELEKSIDKN